ncbi:MAG: type II toxin-antitoxin system RelE/ParE family toxin [Candidatus Micrarchaeota archaeon]|nr:type II toxin-antitoxin system RelE/ParE family toxin [Candidatus Micrarchaeota archaeon]
MAFRLVFTEYFEKDVKALDNSIRIHLKRLYDKIEVNPRRFKPLKGDSDVYRLRILNFRLTYKVVGEEVFMLRFENRGKVYRR